LQIILKLRTDVADRCRHYRPSIPPPADRRVCRMARALRWRQAIKRRRHARCANRAAAVGISSRQCEIAEACIGRHFDALCTNRIDIITLSQIGTDGHIGNRIVELVVECGGAEIDARCGVQIETCLKNRGIASKPSAECGHNLIVKQLQLTKYIWHTADIDARHRLHACCII
jgi:hypothetical protein